MARHVFILDAAQIEKLLNQRDKNVTSLVLIYNDASEVSLDVAGVEGRSIDLNQPFVRTKPINEQPVI